MCQTKKEGGRRCARHQRTRKAYDRATYEATQVKTVVAEHADDVKVSPVTPEFIDVPSWEQIEDAVADARRLTGDPEPRVQIDSKNRIHVLPHGWAVEEASTRVGVMLSIVIDDEVAKRTAELEADIVVDGKHYTAKELDEAKEEALIEFDDMCIIQRETLEKTWHIDGQLARMNDIDTPAEAKLNRKREKLLATYNSREPEQDRLNKVHGDLRKAKTDLDKKLKFIRRDATIDVLAHLRRMGVPEDGVVYDFISSPILTDELGESMKCFPTDWIRSSNNHPTKVALDTSMGRAYYVHEGIFDPLKAAEATNQEPESEEVKSWGEKRVMSMLVAFPSIGGFSPSFIHEFTHRMEYVHVPEGARLAELEDMFLRRRTNAGPHAKGPRQGKRRYKLGRKDEMTRPDDFADPYFGKEYEGLRAREILSTGIEAVFGNKFGNLMGMDGYKADPDHRAFVLGVLATI